MIHPNQNNHNQQYRPPITDHSDTMRPHRLDLYSIPVFILEVFVLALLGLSAYLIHNLYYLEPLVTGFYCDDKSYRNVFKESELTKHLVHEQDELTVLGLLIAIPITFIIFCELINSMFGSIRFRRVRALCNCCKLHSITRRAIRFSGAYLLGFLVVSISCDILSSSTGRLRPFFELKCPEAFQNCAQGRTLNGLQASGLNSLPNPAALLGNVTEPVITPPTYEIPTTTQAIRNLSTLAASIQSSAASISSAHPPDSSRIKDASLRDVSGSSMPTTITANTFNTISTTTKPNSASLINHQQLQERVWIDLDSLGPNMSAICSFNEDSATGQELFQFRQLAKSWPSYPGAIFAYGCLFIAAYLSFAGTARPIRIITCVMVIGLMLLATIFNVQLVKEHFNHSEDVLAGAALALCVNLFIIIVYLNLFRDTHYYERQKMISQRRPKVHENFRPYNQQNGSEFGAYNLDDGNHSEQSNDDRMIHTANGAMRTTDTADLDGSGVHPASGNDLAMRYFQIPRANYRNAPRPLSNMDQMR